MCNNFCMQCGYKLSPGDVFCANCGVKIPQEEKPKAPVENPFSKYKQQILNLKELFEIKESRVNELLEKLFSPGELSYDYFISTINESSKLFYENTKISLKIIDLASEFSSVIEDELKNKIEVLKSILDKMDDLINELIIHVSTDKEDKDEIKSLMEDMEHLIDSVKDY